MLIAIGIVAFLVVVLLVVGVVYVAASSGFDQNARF